MDPRLRGGDGRGCRRGVLLLLDLQDVRRALVAREQICAVVGGDKALERLHPREQPDEIVLPSKRDHGVDQAVAATSFPFLDRKSVGEGKSVSVRVNLGGGGVIK